MDNPPGSSVHGILKARILERDYNNPRKSYNISTEEQLFGLASLVNEEQFDNWKPTRTENFKGVTFNLVKDIELTYYWTPIGTGDAVNFAGIFDGNGHTISGLDIDETSEYTGFFGYLTGQVCNLSIEGDIQSSGNNCGALAGQLAPGGKIVNCVTDVTISGKGQVGVWLAITTAGRCRTPSTARISSVPIPSAAWLVKTGAACFLNAETAAKSHRLMKA